MPTVIAPLPGLDPNGPPGVYGNVNYAQGAISSGTGTYDVLLLGNFGATNLINGVQTNTTAVAATLYGPDLQGAILQTKQDAINLFGDGYALMTMFNDYVSTNPSGNKVYAMPITMASGASATYTLTLTVSGTLTAGQLSINIGCYNVAVGYSSLDTVTTIAARIASYVAGNPDLPVFATSSVGVVTFTTKTVGLRANWLTFQASTVIAGTGLLLNSGSVITQTVFTGGSGSDATAYATAVTALVAKQRRFFNVIVEAGCDNVDGTTNAILSALQSNLIDYQATPTIGIRQRLITGSVDTIANTKAVLQNLNDPLCDGAICQPGGNFLPCQLAARVGAVFNLFETVPLASSGVKFDNAGAPETRSAPYWTITAPLSGAAPSAQDIANAVTSGISLIIPIGSTNRTKLVKAVTSHYWTGSSSQFDPRIVDRGKVTVIEYFLDDCKAAASSYMASHDMVANDPKGTQTVPSNVATPNGLKLVLNNVIDNWAVRGLIDGVMTKTFLTVQRGTNPTSELDVLIPTYTQDIFHRVCLTVNQVQ